MTQELELVPTKSSNGNYQDGRIRKVREVRGAAVKHVNNLFFLTPYQ